MVRGYHIYRDIWIAIVNEVVEAESHDNAADPLAVNVAKEG